MNWRIRKLFRRFTGSGKGVPRKRSLEILEKKKREKPDIIGPGSEIRGRLKRLKDGGRIEVGSHSLIEGLLQTETDRAQIRIGNNVYLGGGSMVSSAGSVEIEDDVLISYRVVIMDHDSHSLRYSDRKNDLQNWWHHGGHDWSKIKSGSIVIKKGAWLGAGCMILKGVTIGEGTVVGAGSVVTKDVPPWTIVAGNPARKIRELGEDER